MWTYAGKKKPGDMNGNDIYDMAITRDPNKKADIATPQVGAPALHWVISEPYERMIRKSGGRLSEKFMLNQGLGARYRPEVR